MNIVMQLGRLKLITAGIYLCCLVNFMCLAFFKSNTTPLILMATAGIVVLFMKRPRINFPSGLFFIFMAYLIGTDIFIFPETSGFVIYRRMLYAFFAGVAVYQVYRTATATFILQYNFCFVIMLLFYLIFCLLTDDFSSIFMHKRLKLNFSHPNGLALSCATVVIGSAACLLFKPPLLVGTNLYRPLGWFDKIISSRAFLIMSALAGGLVLYFTLSRTSFYSCLIVVSVMITARLYQRLGRRTTFIVCAVLIASVGLAFSFPGVFGNSRMVLTEPWNAKTFISRIPLWESGMDAFCQHPILGNGPQSFERTHEQFVRENYSRLVDQYGARIVKRDTQRAPNAHNQYIMFLAENGLIGWLLFMTFTFLPIFSGIIHKSLYGLTIPVYVFFLVIYFFEAPLFGSQSAAFSITVIFMLFGYYTAGQQAGKSSDYTSRFS